MKETWYRVEHWNNGRFGNISVEEVIVTKETDKTVTREIKWGDKIRLERANKSSQDYSFFPTHEEAMALAIHKVNNYIANGERMIREGKKNLEQLKKVLDI